MCCSDMLKLTVSTLFEELLYLNSGLQYEGGGDG